MTRKLIAILLLISACFPTGRALAQEAPARPERVVAGVEIDYPGEAPSGLLDLTGVKKGDRYSPRRISEGVKLLYLKGIFEDINVEGRDTKDGVVLVYHLVPKVRADDIDIEGDDLLSNKKIKSVMAMEEGDFINAAALKKARENILTLYGDEGFKAADAAITTSGLDEKRAVVHVLVKEGAPTVVRDVKFTGETVFPVAALLREVELRPGRALRKEDLEQSVTALEDYYSGKDYVKAQVDPLFIQYQDDTVGVEFRVSPGPRLSVSFEGNEAFSDKKLKKVLTFWDDRDISEESVSENLDKLIDYYKEAGYYFVTLTSRTEQASAPSTVSVEYIVSEGPRVKLKKIVFTGNKEIEADDLEDVMELKESSSFKSRVITDEAVKRDLETLKIFYESKGFLKSEVRSGGIEFNKKGDEAALTINIGEGPRAYVTAVSFEGNRGIGADDLAGAVKLKSGDVFSPQQLKDDQDAVLNLYSQKGYIYATLDVEKKLSEDGRGIELKYIVSEGVPVKVGRVILRGNEQARDVVLTRELLVKPGDVYDYEKILRSQQRIFRMGFFSNVRVQPVDPDKVEPVKDIIVTVKEKDAGAVEFGGGYGDYDKYRGFAEVSYKNLFGYGHRVSLRGELSTKQYRALLSYRWPWFMGWDMDFRANLVRLDAEKPSYTINDWIASVGFEKNIGTRLTTSIYYQYEKIKIDTTNADAVLAPEDKKKSNIASITPSAVLDFRDDPIDPTRGSVHAAVIKWATSGLGSSVDFVKTTAQTSWYYPLHGRIIFGFSARGGIEGWFSESLEIPISERFFIGGASTLRGFSFETVAPRGLDGTPAGGDCMAIFNTEVRFPLPYGFGVVTFLDAGNVWLLNKHVSAAGVAQVGENGLRYGAGAGLRYETPVGPLRLDYGINLNPLPGEAGGVLHFTLGQAF